MAARESAEQVVGGRRKKVGVGAEPGVDDQQIVLDRGADQVREQHDAVTQPPNLRCDDHDAAIGIHQPDKLSGCRTRVNLATLGPNTRA